MKKKVAFYLNNPTLPECDYSSIIKGNPGLGGSEYEFLLVPYLLEQRENEIEVYLFVNFKGTFPHKNVFCVRRLYDVCVLCRNMEINLLVVDIKYFDKNVLDGFSRSLSVLVWAHNTVKYSLLDLFVKLPYVQKIVNVGREQMELYRDHLATLKSTYIYNIFPIKEREYYAAEDRDNHNVVYMGSIVRAKGFHVLASAWKKVLSEIPDAQLYVIGSGKLYNRDAGLGRYGIAEKDYEDLFMSYLTNEKGEVLPSVHFLGILKEEKLGVMGKCKVAVPNPTGVSECLPITAMEMQLAGCSITTVLHPAYLDTVFNKSYLYRNPSRLAQYIIARIKSPSDDVGALYDFIQSRFGVEKNIERWEQLILHPDEVGVEEISEYNYHHKKIKEKLRVYKMRYPLLRCIPPVEIFYDGISTVKYYLSRMTEKLKR